MDYLNRYYVFFQDDEFQEIVAGSNELKVTFGNCLLQALGIERGGSGCLNCPEGIVGLDYGDEVKGINFERVRRIILNHWDQILLKWDQKQIYVDNCEE